MYNVDMEHKNNLNMRAIYEVIYIFYEESSKSDI